jgi:muramoyltetrapeptide carboxypeptidase
MLPPILHHGDTVAITATARKVSEKEMQPAIDILTSWGLQVVTAPDLYASYHQFAGNDTLRAKNLNLLLADKNIKAIFCARGGYGTVRIIDLIDLNLLYQNPKFLIGFSDVTVLHSQIFNGKQLATLHAPMPINMQPHLINHQSINALKQVLFTGKNNIFVPHTDENLNVKSTGGLLTGGNLSVLYSLLGSNSDIDTTDCVLFLEDLDEYLYHIDRMMMALKRAGKLSKIKALLVGGFSDLRDNTVPFGFSVQEIITQIVQEYYYPVIFNVPSGHLPLNMPLLLNHNIQINVTPEGIWLNQ